MLCVSQHVTVLRVGAIINRPWLYVENERAIGNRPYNRVPYAIRNRRTLVIFGVLVPAHVFWSA
jgi:hypothetical protein